MSRSAIVIQDRDRHLLRELATVTVVDRARAEQIAGFGSTTRANVRLLALVRAGLLRRFYIGTSGGARKAIYALSRRGAYVADVPYRGLRRRQDEILVADFSVLHQLGVTDVYCRVKYGPLPNPDTKFLRWVSFHDRLHRSLPLIPDGYFEIEIDGRPLVAFLELDLGTERGKVWPKKVEGYVRYATSGDFGERFGHAQFRVLVVTTSERRVQSLRSATARITKKIFWFTTFEAMEQSGFWSAIWQRPEGDAQLPLITPP